MPPSEPSLLATIPIGLVADRRPCLLVGGGIVALRKAEWLLGCGARIEVVAPVFVPEFDSLDAARVVRRIGTYGAGQDLRPYLLAIAATDDVAVNQAVADDANRAGIPVNVVDDPIRCTFIVPATVARGMLRIAVATGGGSPVLARQLREEFERSFPDWYADYVAALGVVRERLRVKGIGYDARAAILSRLVAPAERATCAGMPRDVMERHLLAQAGLS